MARYAYDVNTTQRYIDVHKQFQGGLKTVDTDDALGAVFLRQAENISLSEFGFIEKRYGTYENFKIVREGELQGYWEFLDYSIYAVNGVLYYFDGVEEKTLSTILTENNDWRYPVLPAYPFVENTYRDMNAVNINNVLYIFTGTYPIYAKVVNEELNFFWFSIDIPTYDEVVVVGHNLLENNYESLYFTDDAADADLITQINETSQIEYVKLEEKEKENFPKFPFVYNEDTKESGSIDFSLTYDFNPNTVGFDNMFENNEGNDLHFLQLSEVFYRNSGAGASSLDFINANLDDVTSNTLTNISDDLTEDFVVFDNEILPKTELSDADLGATRGTGTDEHEIIRGYFTNNLIGSANETLYTFIGKEHNIKKEFNINKLDLDFDKKYAVQFEFLKTEDDPETGDDETLYEVIDFEGLKQGVIDYFQDVYEDTTLQNYYSDSGNSNITESFVRPYNLNRLTYYNTNKNNYKVVITPYNSEGAPFANRITISNFDIEYINKSYVFKIPESVFQSEDVSYYGISFENKVYYLDRTFYSLFEGANSDLIVFDENYTLTPFNLDGIVYQEPIYLEAHTIFEIKNVDRDFFGTSLLNINLKNLLSGNYDFRFNYKLVSYKLENGVLNKTNSLDFISDIFYSVQITQEKLQDYPGVTEDFLPKLEALWSCNKVLEHFGKLMVWGSKKMPTAVFYSFPDRPFYFPSKFYLDFTNEDNKPIESVTSFMNILVAQTEDRTWGIRGNSGLIDSPAPYVPFSINPSMGTIAYKSVRAVRNKLFFLSKQGVVSLNSLYAVDEMYNVKLEDRNIFNIVPQDTKAVGIQYDNQYWLNFPKYGITLRWYVDKNAWVMDRFGSYVNRLGNVETEVGAWNQFNGVFKWQIKNGKLEFISYPSRLTENDNLSLYKIGIDYSLPYDLGEPINAKFQTSFLNQNYPFHPKNYKEFKYDFTVQNEYNPSREPLFDLFQTFSNQQSYAFPNTVKLNRNHTYMISFESELSATHVVVDDLTIPLTALDLNDSGIITDYKFLANNNISEDLNSLTILFGNFTTYSGRISLKDLTYDETLTFKTKLLTEDNVVLNQQLAIGYEEEEADIGVDLEAFAGFTFGTSSFGDRVTLVKTVKLSGKGYNIKSYFEDTSASKWTIESMGITYKMKRARSR